MCFPLWFSSCPANKWNILQHYFIRRKASQFIRKYFPRTELSWVEKTTDIRQLKVEIIKEQNNIALWVTFLMSKNLLRSEFMVFWFFHENTFKLEREDVLMNTEKLMPKSFSFSTQNRNPSKIENLILLKNQPVIKTHEHISFLSINFQCHPQQS